MMSESNDASSSSTTRLRRRSFVENMETADGGPTSLETVSLTTSDTDSMSIKMRSSSSDDMGSHQNSPASSSSSSPSSSVLPSGGVVRNRGGSSKLAVTGRLRAWMTIRFQLLLQQIGNVLGPWLRKILPRYAFQTNDQPIKHWVYPTQWLTYASISLIGFQIIVFWFFQTQLLDLHVQECVFQERLMPSLPASDPHLLQMTSSGASLRYLERRFDQQLGFAAKPAHQQRLPWTCIAIVPSSSEDITRANEFAFLLPRSQIVPPNRERLMASRLELTVGGSSLSPKRVTDQVGVRAAWFPLSSFRKGLFGEIFPDMVLVKSEFALKQLLKYRQERQEELLHRPLVTLKSDPDMPSHLELSQSQFGIFLLKTTVPDIYDRHIRKDWNKFLHVVVVSEQDKKEQFTEELLTTWLQHPEWPTLVVRFANSVTLCGSFQRFLSSVQQDDHRQEEEEAINEEAFDEEALFADEQERVQRKKKKRQFNIDLSCEEEHNTRRAIVQLKNEIGMHVLPVPPGMEVYENLVLESSSVGAITITYNTPIMQEWVPDASGIRLGTFELAAPTASPDGDLPIVHMPVVHVTVSDIENAVVRLLTLDRVHRVTAGRAARVHYLGIRTHYLSAIAALDSAICENDIDDYGEQPSEIGRRSRRKIEVETLRVFLY